MVRAFAVAVAALALVANASPVAVEKQSAVAEKRWDWFYARFYSGSDCSHSAPAESTYPYNNANPITGTSGVCYSAPEGTNWQHVEISIAVDITTFCHIGCEGYNREAAFQNGVFDASVYGYYNQTGENCVAPPAGCAIGSFYVW